MKAAALALLFCSLAAGAHEVHHRVAATGAAVVSLSYADGSPFAYEKYELIPDGRQIPLQVGNSDAAGRVVFLPGDVRRWRIKAYAADGHGLDLVFDAPAVAAPMAAAEPTPDRGTQVVVGLSVLFGLFGLLQMFLRRKQP